MASSTQAILSATEDNVAGKPLHNVYVVQRLNYFNVYRRIVKIKRSDSDAVFSNYDAADMLVKASRPRLAQPLRLACVASYIEGPASLVYKVHERLF